MTKPKTPEQVATEIVDRFSWNSNVVEGGCLVGQQHAVAKAIAQAIKAERDRCQAMHSALCDGAIALIGITRGRLKPAGRVAKNAARDVMAATYL